MEANNYIPILARLATAYPKSNPCIGGSFAVNSLLPLRANTRNHSDVDIYLKVTVARHSFLKTLVEDIFPDIDIIFTTEYSSAPGDPRQYKMPHIIRRVGVSFPDKDVPNIDFILLNPLYVAGVPWFLMYNQASDISRCALEYVAGQDYLEKVQNPLFTKLVKAVTNNTKHSITLNVHPDSCTVEHRKKVLAFCKNNDIGVITHNLDPYYQDLN